MVQYAESMGKLENNAAFWLMCPQQEDSGPNSAGSVWPAGNNGHASLRDAWKQTNKQEDNKAKLRPALYVRTNAGKKDVVSKKPHDPCPAELLQHNTTAVAVVVCCCCRKTMLLFWKKNEKAAADFFPQSPRGDEPENVCKGQSRVGKFWRSQPWRINQQRPSVLPKQVEEISEYSIKIQKKKKRRRFLNYEDYYWVVCMSLLPRPP
jgi:hypothetical protein